MGEQGGGWAAGVADNTIRCCSEELAGGDGELGGKNEDGRGNGGGTSVSYLKDKGRAKQTGRRGGRCRRTGVLRCGRVPYNG